jgi:hypothetical protein
MPRPDWSRPLPRPLLIPDVMTLTTLADVRELLRHVPRNAAHSIPGVTLPRCLMPLCAATVIR